MPFIKTANGQEVYIHDKYPLMIEPTPAGLTSSLAIFFGGGVAKTEVQGTVQTLGKAFMGEDAPKVLRGL